MPMVSRWSWSTVSGAMGYKIKRFNKAGTLLSDTPLGASATSADILAQPNTFYREELYSVSPTGLESAPVVKEFTTPPATGAPATPGNATQEVVQ